MTSEYREWDFDELHRRRPRAFAPEVIDGEYTVVGQRRYRSPVAFGWCLAIVIVVMAVVLRFFWSGLLMAAILIGVTSPGQMLALLIGLAIIGAAWLHARLAGRPF
jgi:hypothetical protein